MAKEIILNYPAFNKFFEIHTDHKKLVHESEMKTSQHVMHWRLLLEEYGPEIV